MSPAFVGAGSIVLAALLVSVSCEKPKSPRWNASETAAAAESAMPPKQVAPVKSTVASPSQGLRFITYNVKNWLKMDRYVDKVAAKDAPKPQSEKNAVIAILTRHQPDVIGLCEIGSAEDLGEIQQLLQTAGVSLPYSHFTGGADPVRHLGFLSKYPITSTGKAIELDYQIQGKVYGWNRAVLDATITANGRPYHFLGVHLKSKREVEEGDEEEMRRGEARLLRRHVDRILEANPDERLIIYGDFNDTRGSFSGKQIFGTYSDPKYLTAIVARDGSGTTWTHFWSANDIYSRIDFVTVSRALKPETDFPAARVLDDPEWEQASDHRAVLAIFK